jgi:hypothetical protein
MFTCSVFSGVLCRGLGGFGLSIVLILGGLITSSHAEIYTYEKNGVIIISSEPPPKPNKRRRVRRTRTKRGTTKKHNQSVDPKHQAKLSKSINKRDQRRRYHLKRKAVKLPRKLRKYKREIKVLSEKYKLPDRLLMTIFNACHQVHKGHTQTSEKLVNPYTCLSESVVSLIERYLKASYKTKRYLIEHSAWLIRKLINQYRGDLTLALSAYYFAAQDPQHSTHKAHQYQKMSLHHLVNKSRSFTESSQAKTNEDRPSFDSRTFLRLVLSFKLGEGS